MPAVSVHIERKKVAGASGQTRHDLREKVPPYVDKTRTGKNSVLIKPLAGDEMLKICKNLRDQRGIKRAMKKNCNVSIAGIITFSKNAQKIIESLDKSQQDELILKAGKRISEHLNLDLTGLTVHRDESAVHAHFQMPAYNKQGFAMSDLLKPSDLSQLQDITAEIFKEYGIGRGKPKKQRIQDGEDYSKYIHRSVKELHDDLPRELAEQQAKLEKNQRLIAQNEQKLAEGNLELEKIEKINKNIEIYKKREADAKAKLEKLEALLNNENPPAMPKSQVVEIKTGLFKTEEKEVIELSDFKAYDKDKTIWATKTFSKENEKKKQDLDKKENELAEKEKKLQEKETAINNKILIDAKYQNLVNDTAKQIMKIAGVDTKKELQQERAIDILRHFVNGGLSAVKDFLLNISKKNTLSR